MYTFVVKGYFTGGTLVCMVVPWGNGNDSNGLVVDMAVGVVNTVPLHTTWFYVRIHQTMAG